MQSGGATGSLNSARSRLPRLSLFRTRDAVAAADADGSLTPPSRELSATSASSVAAGSPPGDEAVRVVVRVRPPGARDARAAPAVATRGGREVTLSEPGRAEPFAAAFDAALGAGAGQAEVYAAVGASAVRHCLGGFNATVIAYGQTGSGKTHTVLGDEAALAGGGGGAGADLGAAGLPPGAGLAPRIFSALFAALGEAAAAGGRHSVRCSLLEIYREDVLDLLAPGGGPLAVRDGDAARGVYVEGLSEVECGSAAEVLALLARGAAARRSTATAMNDRSSRSHCVLTAAVAATAPPPRGGGLPAVRRSKLNLVDLAGSERVGRSGAKGEALTEARSINRSLAVLGRVAAALGERQRRGSGAGATAGAAVAGSATDRGGHVPFRDSKLTFLLQESLGGNARTAVVACVAPGADSASETFSTLAFASGARRLRCRPVADEGGAGSPRALAADNARLRRLVAELRAGGVGGEATAGGAASPSELRQQLEEQRELFDQNNACLLALRAELADVRRALGAAAGAAGAAADEAAALRSDNAALALQAQRAAAALGEASSAAGAAERERDALREERGRVEAAAAVAGADRDAAVVERIAAVGARDTALAERDAAFSERAAAFAERDAAAAVAAALAEELAATNSGLFEARAACEAAAAELADVRAARAAAAAALDEARGEARRAAREAREEAAAAAAREAELRREGAAAATRVDALVAEAAAASARLGREASSRQKYQRMVGEIGRLIDWAQAGLHAGGGAAAAPSGAAAAARPPPRAAAAKGAAAGASPPPALRSWIERV